MSDRAFKMSYDNLNPIKYGFADPIEELKYYPMELIDHIHLKDIGPDMIPSEQLGRGIGNVCTTADILKARGFTGWIISYNYYKTGGLGEQKDPFESAVRDLKTIRRFFRDYRCELGTGI